MLKIKLEDVDALYRILWKLSAITYLQNLMLSDKQQHFADDALRFAYDFAQVYLSDWQCETVLELEQLLKKEDFAV